MHADTTGPAEPAAPVGSGSATRARILTAASELFYGQGIRATSADRIIGQVGITKVTFYRHFRTKSDLVVAYLKEQAAAERAWMESTYRKDDPEGSLRTLATGIGAASCRPGFRGARSSTRRQSSPIPPTRSGRRSRNIAGGCSASSPASPRRPARTTPRPPRAS